MRTTSAQEVADLQTNPANIRNICILAHVDHGKTTLADALVASNGIISQKMAGKMRYMDSWEEEQLRGITMKSSAISLLYGKEEKYLINLIDSPGHVDFSSEVSTAVRLCDGAIVLVDVVEGVCPQTHAVLRQAWLENIRPLLVLNKLDRLITELKMEPMEAYFHLQQILVQVNLLTNQLFTSEAMEKTSIEMDSNAKGHTKENGNTQSYDWTILEDEEEDKNIYFSPDRGNVVFASALDGWGFTIAQFAKVVATKLGIKSDNLQKTLWGDFYLNSKTKRIMKGAQSEGKKPLFVQFVLSNLWTVYNAVICNRDKEMTEKIVKSLNLKIAPRDARYNDPRVHLQAITSQWLPISEAVLSVVVDQLPSPLKMSEERVEKLLCSQNHPFNSFPPETQALKTNFLTCSPDDDSPVVVFVSKMFPVDDKALPQNRQRPLTEREFQQRREQARLHYAKKLAESQGDQSDTGTDKNELLTDKENQPGETEQTPSDAVWTIEEKTKEKDDQQKFVAFARVFSGTIRKGQRLYILGPKHDPSTIVNKGDGLTVLPDNKNGDNTSDSFVTSFVVQDLYLFMGRELETLDHVPAGNILGIGGLESHILKSATISSTLTCPAFTDLYFDAHPIVRVAVEPVHAGDMDKLMQGLRLLNQADPCVKVLVQETGEHVIITAGEVHLKRCLDDLRDRYGKLEVNASAPIVPFRETIIDPPKLDMVNEAIQDQSAGIKTNRLREFEDDEEVLGEGLVELLTPNKKCCIRIRALPLPESVARLLSENEKLLRTLDQFLTEESDMDLNTVILEKLKELKSKLDFEFEQAGKVWKGAVDQIWSFGPRRRGPNILLNRVPGYNRMSVWACLERSVGDELKLWELDNSIVSGFQMATLAGPLCEEPMYGVCFVMENWQDLDSNTENSTSHLNGQRSVDNGQGKGKSSGIGPEKNILGDDSRTEEIGEDFVSTRKKEVYGPLSGQIMACVKEGCRKAFRTQAQRLMAAMYTCTTQATADVLGKLYGVLGKRNGRILSEDMKEGTQFFNVVATLPVVESFGFAEDIRKRTSGLASPQLKFSHWEVIDIDPFWVPTTEEEYLHFGEKADSSNRAERYMNDVRRRKGLKVDEKIVQRAEKQRTLTKNK